MERRSSWLTIKRTLTRALTLAPISRSRTRAARRQRKLFAAGSSGTEKRDVDKAQEDLTAKDLEGFVKDEREQ
jgi:hypothetical protein